MRDVKNHLKICDLCQRKVVSKKKKFTFHLNWCFMTESMCQYCSYTIIWRKTLFDTRSKESFEINWKQSFCQDKFKICSSLHLWKHHLSTWMFQTFNNRRRLKKQKANRNFHSKISNQAIDNISFSFASQ